MEVRYTLRLKGGQGVALSGGGMQGRWSFLDGGQGQKWEEIGMGWVGVGVGNSYLYFLVLVHKLEDAENSELIRPCRPL